MERADAFFFDPSTEVVTSVRRSQHTLVREDPGPALEKVREGLWANGGERSTPMEFLPLAERQRRARARVRAHMQLMALASSRKRAARRGVPVTPEAGDRQGEPATDKEPWGEGGQA
jgi:hypothetical protein